MRIIHKMNPFQFAHIIPWQDGIQIDATDDIGTMKKQIEKQSKIVFDIEQFASIEKTA